MAKKKSWGIDLNDTEKSAKDSIKSTSHFKPKKQLGRPKVTEEETTRVLITVPARKLLKKLAALNDTNMTEYLKKIIYEDAKRNGLIK